MKRVIQRVSVVADILGIAALLVYVFVDNTTLDIACCIVNIFACIMEIIYLCTRKENSARHRD